MEVVLRRTAGDTEAGRDGGATLDGYPAHPDAFPPDSYTNRGLERAAVAASAEAFSRMVQPSLAAALECGNMYAGEFIGSRAATVPEREGLAQQMC
jgi:3-hydroxy-3-methylglutaryl CoA synthase